MSKRGANLCHRAVRHHHIAAGAAQATQPVPQHPDTAPQAGHAAQAPAGSVQQFHAVRAEIFFM